MASPSLNFRLPQEMLDETTAVAQKLDRSPGWIAREALKKYLASVRAPKVKRAKP